MPVEEGAVSAARRSPRAKQRNVVAVGDIYTVGVDAGGVGCDAELVAQLPAGASRVLFALSPFLSSYIPLRLPLSFLTTLLVQKLPFFTICHHSLISLPLTRPHPTPLSPSWSLAFGLFQEDAYFGWKLGFPVLEKKKKQP